MIIEFVILIFLLCIGFILLLNMSLSDYLYYNTHDDAHIVGGDFNYLNYTINGSVESLADKYKLEQPPLAELMKIHESIPINLNAKYARLIKIKTPQALINKLAINTILHLKTIDSFATNVGESALRRNLLLFKHYEARYSVGTYILDIEYKLKSIGTVATLPTQIESVLLETLIRTPVLATYSDSLSTKAELTKIREEHALDIRRYQNTIEMLQKSILHNVDLRECKDKNIDLQQKINNLVQETYTLKHSDSSPELSRLKIEYENIKRELNDSRSSLSSALSNNDKCQQSLQAAERNLLQCNNEVTLCVDKLIATGTV